MILISIFWMILLADIVGTVSYVFWKKIIVRFLVPHGEVVMIRISLTLSLIHIFFSGEGIKSVRKHYFNWSSCQYNFECDSRIYIWSIGGGYCNIPVLYVNLGITVI